jgi:hypothetical protein
MPNRINLAPLAIVIGIAIVFQLALIGADCRQTPVKVAKRFAEAYYAIDADMQNYLCGELAEGGELVGDYLYAKQQEASLRGFDTSFLRHEIIEVHMQTVEASDDSVTIHMAGTTRVCINRSFMIIGKLFQISHDYPMEATIELKKENGQWRVCGNPFGLNHDA